MTADAFIDEAERLRPVLRGVAGTYLGDSPEAEDVVQDVLLKLWSLHVELHSPIAPLARVLVRNVSIDLLRRRRPTVEMPEKGIADAGPMQPQYAVTVERIMQMVGELPPRQQIILRLRHIEEMEITDIARLLGTNDVAVRKALSRARKTLRDRYLEEKRNSDL